MKLIQILSKKHISAGEKASYKFYRKNMSVKRKKLHISFIKKKHQCKAKKLHNSSIDKNISAREKSCIKVLSKKHIIARVIAAYKFYRKTYHCNGRSCITNSIKKKKISLQGKKLHTSFIEKHTIA